MKWPLGCLNGLGRPRICKNNQEVATLASQSCLKRDVPKFFESLSEDLRDNKEVATQALQRCYAVDSHKVFGSLVGLLNNKEVAILTLQRCYGASSYKVFGSLAEELRSNKEVAILALRGCHAADIPEVVGSLSEKLRGHKEIAILALKRRGNHESVFELLPEEVQKDAEVAAVMALCRCERDDIPDVFRALSKTVRSNKEVASLALDRGLYWDANTFLGLLTEDMQKDAEMAAIVALQSANTDDVADVFGSFSEELRNKNEVAILASRQDRDAFRLCSDEQRNNETFCFDAIKENFGVFHLCPEELRNHDAFCVEVLRSLDGFDGKMLFGTFSEELRNNKDVAIQAVKRCGEALKFCSDVLKNDKEVALMAVKQNGDCLQYCSEELRGDKYLVMQAARQRATALKFAKNGLSQDRDCVRAAGLWRDPAAATDMRPEEGILSVKFGFTEGASKLSTIVAEALARHPQMSKFNVYNPNLYCKKSCDRNFTDLSWPCRGTTLTCELEKKKPTTDVKGYPTVKSCWRLSFRLHQQRCKESGGFMIQLQEHDELGPGQQIETLMAEELQLKVFRFCWNLDEANLDHQKEAMGRIVTDLICRHIFRWIEAGKENLKMEAIEPDFDYYVRQASSMPGVGLYYRK